MVCQQILFLYFHSAGVSIYRWTYDDMGLQGWSRIEGEESVQHTHNYSVVPRMISGDKNVMIYYNCLSSPPNITDN